MTVVPDLSEYKAVWLFAMFDLPVTTKEARSEYRRFHDLLLKRGYTMLQFSVYARYFKTEDAGKAERGRLRAALPPEGQVRLISITERQFGKMDVYQGKTPKATEDPPKQLMLF